MKARQNRRIRAQLITVLSVGILAGFACNRPEPVRETTTDKPAETVAVQAKPKDVPPSIDDYATVKLTADLRGLSQRDRQMLSWLILAADQMDAIFWLESCGDKDAILATIDDPALKRLVEINYGPWNRLGENAPLLPDVGPKPLGAEFYPHDMTREEFEAYIETFPEDEEEFKSQYTVIRRNQQGRLFAIPYHGYFDRPTLLAAEALSQAAAYADDPIFKTYLRLRAKALRTGDYGESDFAWMEIKDSPIDLVIGPIEHYEDSLFGYKATHEAMVLLKDQAASEQLAHFVMMLPSLQRDLPVADDYKRERPGTESDLGVYDVLYCAGDANATKAIGVNLPNDEQVQLQKGARRLQLRNVCRAKYEKILRPIAGLMIADDQLHHVRFDAFFEHVLFHEVAHGLGIKHTINGNGLVREALLDQAGVIEEAKADLLGLHILAQLRERGAITRGETLENYVTYVADMSRMMRWGVADAYGQMTMMIFGFMQEQGAIIRDDAGGKYRVDAEKMERAVAELSGRILTIQGDGDYEAAKALIARYGVMTDTLKADLARIQQAGVPIDLVFEQGPEVLGIQRAG